MTPTAEHAFRELSRRVVELEHRIGGIQKALPASITCYEDVRPLKDLLWLLSHEAGSAACEADNIRHEEELVHGPGTTFRHTLPPTIEDIFNSL